MADVTAPSESDLHDAAVKMGSEGGKVGGPSRARKLSAAERSKIAREAALARWSKERLKKTNPKSKKKPKSVKPPKTESKEE